MLTLLCGRSGSGKTAYMLRRLREGAERGVRGRIMLVPEQFSHEAERSLAAALGPKASLFAEVLSFTRLANRVAAECGGAADVVPDRGAKLLMLSCAVSRVSSRLTICGGRAARTGYLENILRAIEDLDAADVSDDAMLSAAEAAGGAVAEKLSDLSVIREAYAQVRSELLSDSREVLDRLIDRLPGSESGSGGVFVDGFTDFTGKELAVLDCFLRRGVDMTVALTTDGSDAEEFSVCEKTKNTLAEIAARRGVRCEIVRLSGVPDKPPELLCLDAALTDYGAPPFEGETKAVEIYRVGTREDECALAAARILDMMRADPTLRRRDFTVAAPDYASYAPACEGVMREYGVAAYSGRRADVLQKPLIRLATSALDAVTGGWRSEDVFAYLKTGLTGLAPGDVDVLENYCLTWDVRGSSMWTREQPWTMSPNGNSYELSDAERLLLERINTVRAAAALPLAELERALKNAPTVADKTRALWDMLEGLRLSERLAERAAALRTSGDAQSADETDQLWGILVDCLEQLHSVLGPVETDDADFARHLKLLLSQYEVGTIPASLDAVTLCDLAAVRGRPKRCVIVLGATADAIPASGASSGLFSCDEREKLAALGIDIGGGNDESVARELFTVYSALTAASEKLILTWPESGERRVRPSFIVTRVAEILGAEIRTTRPAESLTYAVSPCLRLAVGEDKRWSASAAEALELKPERADRLRDLMRRLRVDKSSLAPESVSALYGKEFRLSASRAESFTKCRYSYFIKYGLRASPRKKAEFDGAAIGTFAHYILENVVRDVKKLGGFGSADAETCEDLAERYLTEYCEKLLAGREKSGRFTYLLGTMKETVRRIVREVLDELRDSDFEPLDFELSFEDGGDLPPGVIRSDGTRIKLSGKIDRVDGWTEGDTLYLRVADYKTGSEAFSLSNVWYGLGMQMLIYLFMLADEGEERYGKKIAPAGVLYLPAKDTVLSLGRDATDEEIEEKRREKSKRTGIALNDEALLKAMDKSGTRLVFKTKRGGEAPVKIASAERLGMLAKLVRKNLADIGAELEKGSIGAEPCCIGSNRLPCEYCEFASACPFDPGKDRARRFRKMTDEDFWQRLEKGGGDRA